MNDSNEVPIGTNEKHEWQAANETRTNNNNRAVDNSNFSAYLYNTQAHS